MKTISYYKVMFLIGVLFVLIWNKGCSGPRVMLPNVPDDINNIEPMIPASYIIGPGDELEILYHIDPGFSVPEYIIDTEDTLRIDFYYYPVLSKTTKVRPDGFITLPRVGEVKAATKKPKELAEDISRLYEEHLAKPVVTVEVLEFNVKIQKLKEAVQTTVRGQSKQVIVRYDGKITLPYIENDVIAAGRTLSELTQELRKHYQKILNNLSITASLLSAQSNKVYVMGEVNKSDYYQLYGPLTLSQLIARAGGFTKQANIHQIVIIRRSHEGKPEVILSDLEQVIGKGDISADTFINQYDVVFVPRTKLSQAALAAEQVWSLIPIDFTVNYSIR